MKIQETRYKFQLLLLSTLVLLGQTAFGAAITKSGSAELGAGSFDGTRLSGEVVVLNVSGEAQWTANGVKINQSSTGGRGTMEAVADGNGGAFVTWADTRATGVDVYAANISFAGAVTEKLIYDVFDNQKPRIIKSVNGASADGAIVAWLVYKGNDQIVRAAKFNAAGSDLWAVGSEPVVSKTTGIYDPTLASDKLGGVVIAWQDNRNPGNGSGEIYALRLNSSGAIPAGTSWRTDGITICAASVNGVSTEAKIPQIVTVKETDNKGYMISWLDKRDGYSNLYLHRIDDNGVKQTGDFGENGLAVTSSTAAKFTDFRSVGALSNNGNILCWREGQSPNRQIFAQLVTGGGAVKWFGAGGVALTPAGPYFSPKLAALPLYQSVYSWVEYTGAYSGHIQKLSTYGTPEWGSGGKNLDPLPIELAHDGSNGVYVLLATFESSSPNSALIPYLRRLDGSGSALWGNDARITPYTVPSGDDVKMTGSDDGGAIAVWIDQRSGSRDIYAQKFLPRYSAVGSFTSAKIENTDPGFVAWTTMSWSDNSLSGEVKLAATAAGLDSAAWESIANGGSIASNGKWLQSRFSFTAGASRATTPALTSFSANYNTTGVAISPEVSVTSGGVTLLSGDYIPERPLFNITVTDDARVASVSVLFDGNPAAITYTSTADARWEISCQPTVTIGDHTLQIEATDVAGNTTVAQYALTRSGSAGVSKGGVKALSVGNQVTIAYSMASAALVKIEIRDLVGRKVKELTVDAGASGGAAGYNEFSFDAGGLPIGPYTIYVIPTGGAATTGTFSIVR